MREAEEDFSQREIDNTLALLVDTRSWIQRRTDRVELLDTYTIRRSITFEIELPGWALEALDSGDCRLILPIGIFGGGQVLRNLEVAFGQEPAGTLTRPAGERLTALLRERLKKNGDLGIPHGTRRFLDDLLEIQVEDRNQSGRLGRGALENGNYILFVTSDKSLGGIRRGGSRFIVTVSTDQTLVRRLDAVRQPESIRKALRAIGLGRVTEVPEGTDGHLAPTRRDLFAWFRDFRSKARSVIMPSDTAFVVAQTISGFGDARSWQLEIYAPDELRISDGALIWWNPDHPADEPDVETGGRAAKNVSDLGTSDGAQNEPDRKTHSPNKSGDGARPSEVMNGHAPATRRGTSAVALTRFRVQADSIRHIGLLVTYATIILLTVAIGIALSGGSGPIVDAVVAILVIAPSLGASIVTNPESHEMAGDYLKPLRQRIYLVGFLAALAAAFFIIFGLSEGTALDATERDRLSPDNPARYCAEQPASSLSPIQLRECEEERGSVWNAIWPIWNLDLPEAKDAFDTWSGGSWLSFVLMLLALAALLWVAFSFHRQQRDINRRNRLSGKLLARDGEASKDPSLKVFIETTDDERIQRGLWGRWRSIRNSRGAGTRKQVTLSTDPIDLGPRAIFRMPSQEREGRDLTRRVKPGTLERPYSAGKQAHREALERVPGLFDRFFYGTWVGNEPPPWFFWSSDIEADYIAPSPEQAMGETETGHGGEE